MLIHASGAISLPGPNSGLAMRVLLAESLELASVAKVKAVGDLAQPQCSAVRWEHFGHGADIGIRGIGATMAQSFEQAAIALAAVITDPAKVIPERQVKIECAAPEAEPLLVEWLNALVYEMAVRRMIFSRFEVHVEGRHLRGSAWGEEVDIARHEPAVEVKGATYTSLFVGRNPDGAWVAQCVVDV
jgi:SHS2 domain-containing protein